MPFSESSPLEQSREDALRHLTQLFWWVLAPVSLTLVGVRLATDWAGVETRWLVTILLPVFTSSAAALLLRPSRSRSLAMRGWIGILIMAFIGGWGLFINGPRAANTAALAVVFSLGMLFLDESPAFWGVVAATVLAGVSGFVLRAFSLLAPPPSYGGSYELATALVAVAALVYCARILSATLQNYRTAQAALRQRSQELLAAQAEAQRLQQQELVARVATVLAGEVAGQLDANRAGVSSLEARLQATHTLRLLESLGADAPTRTGPTVVRQVLRGFEEALRPLLSSREALDIVDVSASTPQFDAIKLEQILIHLALEVRSRSAEGTGIVVRAYDGLGDVTRGDGRRTWTIIEVGAAHPDAPPAGTPSATSEAGAGIGSVLAELVVANTGGRLEVERRAGGAVTFVLQLPST